ncbi:MAG: hypothetical protein REI45_00565 [Propionicimonas sp.]|nr:hypothetical protein [Propionicimonas sp.]
MATWRDGPEYAPTVRPAAFVEPPAAPLEAPARQVHAGAEAPSGQPVFSPPEQDTPDLASLIPSTVPGRDPQLAFEVVTSAVTSPTAWGAAHTAPPAPPAQPPPPGLAAVPAWSPQQPLTPGSAPVTGSIPAPPAMQPRPELNPQQFPAPGTPQWFAPPDAGQRYQPPPPSVSLGQVVRTVTPAVLITLAIGALVNALAIVMLALSFGLSTRIVYRTAHVRRLYLVAFGLTGLVAGMSLLADDFYLASALNAASAAAQALCWLMPFALGLVVALALGKGERPDPRP